MQKGLEKFPAVRVLFKDDVLFRQLDDEAVLLDLDSQRYFGLEEVATRLWALLAENPSLPTARLTLLQEFETDAGTLDRDLRVFLGQLLERGLVRLEALEDRPS